MWLIMPYAAVLIAAVWLPHSALLVLHLQAPTLLAHPAGASVAFLDSSHHGRCCAANRCCLAATLCAARTTPAGTYTPRTPGWCACCFHACLASCSALGQKLLLLNNAAVWLPHSALLCVCAGTHGPGILAHPAGAHAAFLGAAHHAAQHAICCAANCCWLPATLCAACTTPAGTHTPRTSGWCECYFPGLLSSCGSTCYFPGLLSSCGSTCQMLLLLITAVCLPHSALLILHLQAPTLLTYSHIRLVRVPIVLDCSHHGRCWAANHCSLPATLCAARTTPAGTRAPCTPGWHACCFHAFIALCGSSCPKAVLPIAGVWLPHSSLLVLHLQAPTLLAHLAGARAALMHRVMRLVLPYAALVIAAVLLQAPTLLAYSHIRLVRVLLSWVPCITRLIMPYAALLMAAVCLQHSALLVLICRHPRSLHIRLVRVLLSCVHNTMRLTMPDAAAANRCCLAATLCLARTTPAGTYAPCTPNGTHATFLMPCNMRLSMPDAVLLMAAVWLPHSALLVLHM
jgi:hypothetical protein